MKKITLLITATLIVNLVPTFSAFAQKNTDIETEHPVEVPKFENFHLIAGDKHFEKGFYKDAFNEYSVVVRLSPTSWKGFRGLGNVFVKQNKIKLAMEHYVKAVDIIDPNYSMDDVNIALRAMRKGNNRLAIEKFQKFLSINPDAGFLVAEGIELFNKRRKSKAQKKFEEAVKLDEKYADGHFQMGNFSYDKKKWDDAIKSYQKAVDLDSNNPEYLSALGNSLYRKGFKTKTEIDLKTMDKAIEKYQSAFNLDSRNFDNMYNLAVAKVARSKFYKLQAEKFQETADKARLKEQGDRIKAFDEKDNPAKFNKLVASAKKQEAIFLKNDKEAKANFALSLSDANSAIYLLRKVTAVRPEEESGHVYLGDAYIIAGDKPMKFIQATQEYLKSINLGGNSSKVFFKVGVAYYLASKLDPISEDLPITEKNSTFYVRYGKKFYRGDMLTNAKKYFSKAGGSKSRTYLATIDNKIKNLGFRVPDPEKGY